MHIYGKQYFGPMSFVVGGATQHYVNQQNVAWQNKIGLDKICKIQFLIDLRWSMPWPALDIHTYIMELSGVFGSVSGSASQAQTCRKGAIASGLQQQLFFTSSWN